MASFSDEPWGQHKDSDYSDEQYRAACLIKGPTREACKLPVKTPSGAINKNGVHSAAAALAGARGGLKGVSPADKKAAARSIVRLYGEMKETPPPSMVSMAR